MDAHGIVILARICVVVAFVLAASPALSSQQNPQVGAREALAANDCVAMRAATRALASREEGADSAALSEQLTVAMLALPDCGSTSMRLKRSRTLSGDSPMSGDQGARR